VCTDDFFLNPAPIAQLRAVAVQIISGQYERSFVLMRGECCSRGKQQGREECGACCPHSAAAKRK